MLSRTDEMLATAEWMIEDLNVASGSLRDYAHRLLEQRLSVMTIGQFSALEDAARKLQGEAWERTYGNRRRTRL